MRIHQKCPPFMFGRASHICEFLKKKCFVCFYFRRHLGFDFREGALQFLVTWWWTDNLLSTTFVISGTFSNIKRVLLPNFYYLLSTSTTWRPRELERKHDREPNLLNFDVTLLKITSVTNVALSVNYTFFFRCVSADIQLTYNVAANFPRIWHTVKLRVLTRLV